MGDKIGTLCFILILLYNIKSSQCYWLDNYHFVNTAAISEYINGTDTRIPGTHLTPDYRVEEKKYIAMREKTFIEQERPYRISPHYKQYIRWPKVDKAWLLGCYCTTAYRRHVTLAGCAVITTRHILTTATPTDLILRSYGHLTRFDKPKDILGFWYDTNENVWNSSRYATPARIHIHPKYQYDYQVNVSHPVPVMYDLSLWVATFRFYGTWYSISKAALCTRGVSAWWQYSVSIPHASDIGIVVGFQFMKAYNRRPLPYMKYAVKTRNFVWPCPKSDWHWYHCIASDLWGKFGFDSGGAMHLSIQNVDWRNDGFVGMCSFSMKLRSVDPVHYFTVIDTHPVLEFIHDAIKGLLPMSWLDERFEDSKWTTSPRIYQGSDVYPYYPTGDQYVANPLGWW